MPRTSNATVRTAAFSARSKGDGCRREQEIMLNSRSFPSPLPADVPSRRPAQIIRRRTKFWPLWLAAVGVPSSSWRLLLGGRGTSSALRRRTSLCAPSICEHALRSFEKSAALLIAAQGYTATMSWEEIAKAARSQISCTTWTKAHPTSVLSGSWHQTDRSCTIVGCPSRCRAQQISRIETISRPSKDHRPASMSGNQSSAVWMVSPAGPWRSTAILWASRPTRDRRPHGSWLGSCRSLHQSPCWNALARWHCPRQSARPNTLAISSATRRRPGRADAASLSHGELRPHPSLVMVRLIADKQIVTGHQLNRKRTRPTWRKIGHLTERALIRFSMTRPSLSSYGRGAPFAGGSTTMLSCMRVPTQSSHQFRGKPAALEGCSRHPASRRGQLWRTAEHAIACESVSRVQQSERHRDPVRLW